MPIIERSIEIHAPIEKVFAFLTDVRNHTQLVPPETQERLLDPGDIPLRLGSVVRFRARYGPRRWTMSSKVTAFVPPEPANPTCASFQDRQVRGPFAVWIHDHRFESISTGGTLLTDTFTYSAPLGPIGRLIERLWLHARLVGLMEHMQEAAKRLLEAD